nr:uncharacterized protein LOC109120020 isoform X2 [Solanum lycopersicum]
MMIHWLHVEVHSLQRSPGNVSSSGKINMHVFLLLCLPSNSSFIMIHWLHIEVHSLQRSPNVAINNFSFRILKQSDITNTSDTYTLTFLMKQAVNNIN